MKNFNEFLIESELGFNKTKTWYHGTNSDFDKFKYRNGDIGFHFGTVGQANSRIKFMKYETPSIIPVHLKLNNPIRINDIGFFTRDNLIDELSLHHDIKSDKNKLLEIQNSSNVGSIRKALQKYGYDGIVYKNISEVPEADDDREKADNYLEKYHENGKSKDDLDKFMKHDKKARDLAEKHGKDSVIVFKPNQIKSIHAKFKSNGLMESDSTINVNGVERSRTNSLGKPIHATDEGIINFHKWFGDSKAVDESGRPLVLYHGSPHEFSEFNHKRFGSHDKGWLGKGHYFTNDESYASSYGEHKPYYIKTNNPLELNEYGYSFNPDRLHKEYKASNSTELTDILKDDGHDAVHLKYDEDDGLGKFHEINVFHPNQIKIADGSNKMFNDNNKLYENKVAESFSKYILNESIRILNESPLLRDRIYNQSEMLARGADGHLDKAYERYIPIDKLDGLEPEPTNNESDDGLYHAGKAIKRPIEVEYDEGDDKYMVYGGNHRIAQAKANGDTHILSFVKPSSGNYIGKHPLRKNPNKVIL